MTRYELLERIGVGGMAEIFRGTAVAGRGFQKPVAIKRILPHLSQDERFVELLITEAKTLSELKHRNIVQIYDVGLGDDGQYFIVMEFVDGLDLADLSDQVRRSRRPLSVDVTLYICAEVCEALEHAHNARDSDGYLVALVHRDVSPSNILLSKSGEVKLTDFGIAKRMEELTGHGGVRGKFAYISPEQAENQHVDGRSDVHSLGIVLFELITNKPLFSHLPDFDALKAVREHQMPNISDIDRSIDPALASLVMRALAAAPGDRYQSAKEFASALRDYRYGMISSTGDPVQAVARTVRDSVSPKQPPPPDEHTLGEGTVVRIISSSGFPGATGKVLDPDEVSTDADPYQGARDALDSYDEDKTSLARTPPPEVGAHLRASSGSEGATEIAVPRGKRSAPTVDPDADTEYALSVDEAEGEGDENFDGDLETRVLNRKDPAMMAATMRGARSGNERSGSSSIGAKRKPPLPSPRQRSSADEQATVPRAEPVGAPNTPAPELIKPALASPMAPRSPVYPTANRDDSRGFGTGSRDGDRFLGMPRIVAYWVVGGIAALLLVIIIALLASRPSGQPQNIGESPPAKAAPQ